ncbi:DNA alkylation repair protein [Candidatus Dependentiae bacterium]|nr:DNA alkylation repair protein [Candidatus Dependentiae bacterium]
MDKPTQIHILLQQIAQESTPSQARFFKTAPGQYAEHDRFLGITVPQLRVIAKNYKTLTLQEIQLLLLSPYNEERLLALFILTDRYKKGSTELQNEIYSFYLANIGQINNWNLVDSSAHLIIGAHLYHKDKDLLMTLAQSPTMWHRRISIIATWYFIRQNNCEWTYTLSEILLHDTHDLMHKAVGWMLREAGKRDEESLKNFLKKHASTMPRTMLRYALEKFPKEEQLIYLHLKKRISPS